MVARFRFAAFAAVSCAGLAGATAFAQEGAKETVDSVTDQVIELRYTTDPARERQALLNNVQAADQALAIAQDAVGEETAQAEEPAGLWLGVQLATEIPAPLAHHLGEAKGALVETVYPDSPAAESGIEAYDLIVRVGEAEVESNEQLIEAMQNVEAKPLDVVVLRGGDKKTISVTPRERATAQPDATAESTDLLFFNLNVPHIRVLPALGGPDAGAFHHRLVTTYGPPANLPENVSSLKIRIEREGEKAVHRVEVTTVDGKTFKAANEEELNALPPEIRAALPLPRSVPAIALRIDAAPGSQEFRQGVIAQGAPTTIQAPQIAVPPPAPVVTTAAPWVDIVRLPDPAALGTATYRVAPGTASAEELDELKNELSELRAAVGRIEKLLRRGE
jgi:hypothetical protein